MNDEMLSKQILPLMPVPIPENSIIVFELILIDVIADLHTVHLIPPGTVLIVLGTAVIETRITPSDAQITS